MKFLSSGVPHLFSLRRCCEKDLPLLEEIWISHRPLFRKIALSVIADESTVEDILQDTYTNLLRRQREFATKEEAFNYLRRAVINTSIDYFRSARRRQSRLTALENWAHPALTSSWSDPERSLLEKEQELYRQDLISDVQKALGKLTREQRQAIDLIFGKREEKTLKEVCKERGIPYSTLRSRMLAGVDRIRRYLQESDSRAPLQEEAESHGLPRN